MFRTLRRDVHVCCPDPATAERLAFISCDPVIAGERERLDLTVEATHGFLKLLLPSGGCVDGTAATILDELHRLRFDLVRAECPEAILLPAGMVTTAAGHVLFVGETVSALMVELAAQGWPVAGDWQAVIEAGGARPFPARLRVGLSDLGRLSLRAATVARASPRIPGWFDQPTYAVAPSAFGGPWEVRAGPVLHIVLVDDNHGGGSRLKPLNRTLAMETMFGTLLPPETGRARALAEFMTLMSAAACWRLTAGCLDDVGRLLQGLTGLETGLPGVAHVGR